MGRGRVDGGEEENGEDQGDEEEGEGEEGGHWGVEWVLGVRLKNIWGNRLHYSSLILHLRLSGIL